MESATALLARDLRVRLGRAEILTGIDLTVNQGDLYGLLGRNGAGKTTAMRCLLGFLPQYTGRCEVFGTPSRRLHKVLQPLGVALDPPGLDDTLSVRQNLELARIRSGIKTGRSVDQVLEMVGLTHRQHNRGDRLSHGQGRRAAVARALLGAPELLVLDEPLSGLDPEGVEQLLELFQHITRDEGVTIILSSHHLREVQDVCNRVGLIEMGKVLLEGETVSLLAEAGEELRIQCRDTNKACEVLRGADFVREAEVKADGWVQAKLEPGQDLAQLLARLAAADIGLQEFRRERASLVDVFRGALA